MTALRLLLTALPLIFFVSKPCLPLRIVALYGLLFGCGLWGLVNLAIGFKTPAGFASIRLQSSAFMSVVVAMLEFKETVSVEKILAPLAP